MILNRVGPMSCAKVLAIIYGGMGLVFGTFVSIASWVGAGIGGDEAGFPGLLFGAGAIVLLPIFYSIVGFFVGLIGSAIYNLAARFMGGVELDLS